MKKSILSAKLILSILAFVLLHITAAAQYSFKAIVTGSGQPMILIPGLYCSGEVWNETVAQFKGKYQCHVLTLPGFAGQPAIPLSDSILFTITHELARYIKANKLVKPIIMGHSLGAYLSLAFGIRYPQLTGDIVCVSGAPFLPGLAMGNNISVDSAASMGKMIKNSMVNQTKDELIRYQNFMLSTMMRDTAKISWVRNMVVSSDAATQGEVMYELFSKDLRADMDKIPQRVLVLGDWIAYKNYGTNHASITATYEQQFAKAKRVTVAINDTAKHFIMFDEPAWFYSQVEGFLQ
jgi:pimeloyl-ACP methyl ester carboxylesterase